MFEKDMRISYLLDFYSDALDEHTMSVMKAYYNDDLSLSEIASGIGISRQGIRHIIKKGEEQLSFLEGKLGLSKRHGELLLCAERLTRLSESLDSKGLTDEAREISHIVEKIMKGN